MTKRTWCTSTGLLTLAVLLTLPLLTVSSLHAFEKPEKLDFIDDKAFRHADLELDTLHHEIGQLPPTVSTQARERLARLGVNVGTARVDKRSGRFITLMPTTPMVPGNGVGNALTWESFGFKTALPDREARELAAWNAFSGFLNDHQNELGIDPKELGDYRIGSHGDGEIYQIWIPRTFDGIPVRGSNITATIGHGNLILFSAENWGDRRATPDRLQLSLEEARRAAADYLLPVQVTEDWGTPEQVYLTMNNGAISGTVGGGYRYVLAWVLKLKFDGDGGSWEVLVDAHTGEILANEDKNHYFEAKGGVYPVTNDGVNPDGVEQPGWPMPFMNVGSQVTDTGGNYTATGNQTAELDGPFVNMADQCGTESLTQSGGIDWGTSGGDDCVTPGFGGAGNTHASRSGFYELNRTKEMGRGWLPNNNWLQNRLTSNMNINNSCNAFWNGSTVNFYRSGGGCSNTGEIAGVFVHEWGHGMDANDVNGGIASPSGEGIADIYTALRLDTSCIGRNFRTTNCTGNGDACLDCTGVRDIDYLKKASGQPHDYTWRNATCGSSVHCIGHVYSEAVWSLWKRKLQQAPYNYTNNRAHEITNRLTFIAAGNTSTWFSGGPPNGGCSGSSGYNNYLAADDDDGNLNNGTPHMVAIYESFNDQEIACQSPSPQDSGCSGTPTGAPNVTASPGDNQVALSWGAVSGASEYWVFRAEGIFGCNFGKVKVGETTGLSFTDTGLQNGRDYSYTVIAKGSSDSCFGGASTCDTVQPSPAPQCSVDADCDDGAFCNGAETCNAGACVAGSNPCGPTETCDEAADQCIPECVVDADCDDGLFCNGAETCNANVCQAGSNPCPGQGCDEGGDQCTAGGPCDHDVDFESGAGGWTQGNDTCTTGSFIVGTPDATAWQVGGGNPGQAFFTQNNGGGLGTDDVDGGTCEALSPTVDCNGHSAADVSLDYYHGQRDAGDDANDGFTIEVLNNGVVVDTIVDIGDVTNNAAWTTVSTTVANPGDIQIRVRASDAAGPGDIVEAGIDNVTVSVGAPPPACTVDDDFESGTAGWNNDAASTCSTGAYVEGNPTEVVNSGVTTQIGGSNSGTTSIFTATNTSAGVNDVDGGNCILNSPSWSVTNASTLSVWYWHGQRDAGDDASGDFFLLEYSTNGGSSWTTLASNGDSTSNAAWTNATAAIPAGSNVQLRMQCSDGAGPGDLVECGLDDVSICE